MASLGRAGATGAAALERVGRVELLILYVQHVWGRQYGHYSCACIVPFALYKSIVANIWTFLLLTRDRHCLLPRIGTATIL